VSEVENLGAWLTTVVARLSLNMLRSRKTRREEPLAPYVPDPIIDPDIVLKADGGSEGPSSFVRGAETVASQAQKWSGVGLSMRRALINGAPGSRLDAGGAAVLGLGGHRQRRQDRGDQHPVGPRRLSELDFAVLED
jgi:hypothetical protein